MGLLDNLKGDVLQNVKASAAQAAQDAVDKVTKAIPGELDDQVAGDVLQSVEKNLGIETDTKGKTTKK